MLAELHPKLPSLLERSTLWISRRRSFAAMLAGAALVICAVAALTARIDGNVALFDTELHPAQAIEVEDALTLWGETFHANSQGTQIFVGASRRRDLLLRLTLAGLPHRYMPTSADVLEDQANALTPQSVVDDRRRSGIEGDLVAGLRRISGVADASVVLPPTADDPFGDDATRAPPSAAVQVVMQPGARLSAEAVAGIKRFVASAYPRLSSDRVTVVDGSGAMLGGTPPPDRAASRERRVQSAVQSALDSVLGAGSAVVRVSVRTAGVEQQMQATRIIPHGIVSADVGRESGSESGKTFEKERSLRRYAYDTVSEKRTTAADSETRMSIAVFLDAHRVDRASSGPIASLVRAAAGADLQSGDDVVVQSLSFASPAPEMRAAPPSPRIRALTPAAIAIVALALFALTSLPQFASWRAPTHTLREPAPDEVKAIDPAASAALGTLAGESPQTAAYVMANMAPGLRDAVLRACDPVRRGAIREFLDLKHID